MENFGNNLMPEAGLDFEKESKLRETINLIALKKNEEGKMEISELVKELAGDLPVPLQEMVMGDFNSIKELTDDEDVLRRSTEISFTRLIAGYETKLTDKEKIPNASYAMVNAMEKIDAVFKNKEIQKDDFKKIARVSFDVNGLKAVNDLNQGDHKKGDEYLAIAARAIRSQAAIDYAREHGINFEPDRVTRDGGDEFSIIVTGENPLEKDVLDGLILAVQDEFWNNSDVQKVLDFENANVLASYAKVPVSEIKEKFNGDSNAFKAAYGIPSGYKYRGAMAGGAATIYDSLMDEKFDDKNNLGMRDKYRRMLQKTIGAMFSSSDRRMNADKEKFKKDLSAETADSIIKKITEKKLSEINVSFEDADKEAKNKNFLAKVYSRTDKEKELTGMVNTLSAENSEIKTRTEKILNQVSLITEVLDAAVEKEDWATVKKANQLLKDLKNF